MLGVFVLLQSSLLTSQTLAAPSPATTCPWLTEGTAANVLNGDVLTMVTLTDKSQGICTFTTRDGATVELKIIVDGESIPSCPRDSPLVVAIGTRANECSLYPQKRRIREMISGAVREKNFAVSITTESKVFDSLVSDRLRRLAEIVAGNLF